MSFSRKKKGLAQVTQLIRDKLENNWDPLTFRHVLFPHYQQGSTKEKQGKWNVGLVQKYYGALKEKKNPYYLLRTAVCQVSAYIPHVLSY